MDLRLKFFDCSKTQNYVIKTVYYHLYLFDSLIHWLILRQSFNSFVAGTEDNFFKNTKSRQNIWFSVTELILLRRQAEPEMYTQGSFAPRYRTTGDLVGFVAGKKYMIPIIITILEI